MNANIDQIKAEAYQQTEKATSEAELNALTIKYLGRKGEITKFLRNIPTLPEAERPQAGQKANMLKKELADLLQNAIAALQNKVLETDDAIDVSLPGRRLHKGALHPLNTVAREICEVFCHLGFSVVEGPEVETDYYNFEALNIPKNHPAREMQDTFYIAPEIVLRTHTSPTQPRVMEKNEPPVRIIAPGKVYRCDSDLTHTPMFHQVEGLCVDENISFGDLKGILTTFVHQTFDSQTSLRFRPSFFPFTEPSAEVDIRCVMCRGEGCRVCSGTGWLEILGSGMVHPAVFEKVGYDTKRYSGFAFGMGLERIAMLKYGLDDIRRYYENDIRFLGQF